MSEFPRVYSNYDPQLRKMGYRWTVHAYDSYGNMTPANETRDALVDPDQVNPGAPTAGVIIRLENKETSTRITNAAVVTGGLQLLNGGQGEYLMAGLFPNQDYPFTVTSAPGFTVPVSTTVHTLSNTFVPRTVQLTPECPAPLLIAVDPPWGPVEGGGQITVYGADIPETGLTVTLGNAAIPSGNIEHLNHGAIRIHNVPHALAAGATRFRPVSLRLSACGEEKSLPAAYTYTGWTQHAADTRMPSWSIDLSELLRVIQLYNSPGFGCDPNTEDGYAPTGGPRDCPHHQSDYAPADWRIGLSELLRTIQFFNAGGYRPAPGTEDGFAPGLARDAP